MKAYTDGVYDANPKAYEIPDEMIRYAFRTLREARERSRRGTRWLSDHGCNQILMVRRATREVEIPSDVAKIWPGICDLMTE